MKMKYYIRIEGYLGNALMWWRKGGGYTCDIKEAEKFTEDNAKGICKRPDESAYECKYIDGLKQAQKLIIDSQFVDADKRLWEK